MSSSNEPLKKYMHWTDESGVVEWIVLEQCPKCREYQPKSEYTEHYENCKGPLVLSPSAQQISLKTASKRSKGTRSLQSDSLQQLSQTRNSSKHKVSNPMVFSRCSYCYAQVRKDRLAKHIARVHAEAISKSFASPRKEQEQATSKKVIAKALVRCPVCKTSVKSSRLENHIRKVHPSFYRDEVDTELNDAINLKPARETPNQIVQCPRCLVKIASKRLDKHMKTYHSEGTSNLGQNRGKAVSRTNHGKNIKNQQYNDRSSEPINAVIKNEDVRDSFDDLQDGSKYWGFMRREQGRYGSFPMFDDYSEESEP